LTKGKKGKEEVKIVPLWASDPVGPQTICIDFVGPV